MARPKGTPKTGGRKKGTPNKTTAQIKELVVKLVGDNIDTFAEEFEKLDAGDKIGLIKNLLPYVIPKQTETKHSFDAEQVQSVKESMDKLNEMFK